MSIRQTPQTELYEQLPPEEAGGIAANRQNMQGFFEQPANNAEGSGVVAGTYPYETSDQADTQELPAVVDEARPYTGFQEQVVATWTQGDSTVGWEEASARTSERVARTATRASLGSAALTLAGVAVSVAGMFGGNEKAAIAGVVATGANIAAGAVQRRVRSWARSNSNS